MYDRIIHYLMCMELALERNKEVAFHLLYLAYI